MWWTFNMPSDHAEVTLTDVRVPDERASSARKARASRSPSIFVHENRIRQAASGVGVGAVLHQRERGLREASASSSASRSGTNQAIQFPLAELQTECEMVRGLVYKTAWQLDRKHHMDVSDKVSMCNYRANRLALRRRRPRDPGARRHRLHAPQAVRAHLPPPPALPHHRGQRRDPAAQDRRPPVRVHGRPAPLSPAGQGSGPVAVAGGHRYAPGPLGRGPHRA